MFSGHYKLSRLMATCLLIMAALTFHFIKSISCKLFVKLITSFMNIICSSSHKGQDFRVVFTPEKCDQNVFQ